MEVLPGTTPLVAMALIDMAVSIVCKGKGQISYRKEDTCVNYYLMIDLTSKTELSFHLAYHNHT